MFSSNAMDRVGVPYDGAVIAVRDGLDG